MKNQKEVVEVTRGQLIETLKGVEKSTFIYVVMETLVRMNKKGNPYHNEVTKRTKGQYLIGNDYEKRVQSNEKKEGMEGTFQTEFSRVGEHVSKCVLFNEKLNTFYLQMERFEEVKPIETEYIHNDNPIDKMLFEDFMVKSSPSQKQQQDKKVMVLSPKIDNIKELSLNGIRYIVTE